MKCPIMFQFQEVEPNILGFHGLECLKGSCAWWYEDGARCCILDLDITLMNMELELADIEKHLSKGG